MTTPEQLAIIERTVAPVTAEPERFGGAFYAELFRLDPEARGLFGEEMADQRSKLVAELSFLGEAARDLDGFVERARDLGARHAEYGVAARHYQVVERALLAGVAAALVDVDDATIEAWRALYWLIAETMIEGASSAVMS